MTIKQRFNRWRWKNRLYNAFHIGGIYRLQKLEDGKEKRHLPKIKSVVVDEEKGLVKYYVELRLGINPKLIQDNKWIIEQRVGKIKFLEISQHRYMTIQIHI